MVVLVVVVGPVEQRSETHLRPLRPSIGEQVSNFSRMVLAVDPTQSDTHPPPTQNIQPHPERQHQPLQAIDRAHRIGQHRAVRVLRLIVRGTVEERILDMQARL